MKVIRGEKARDNELKYRTGTCQETDTAEVYACIQRDGQSLELVEKFYNPDDTIVV